jgi:hypothetical protein
MCQRVTQEDLIRAEQARHKVSMNTAFQKVRDRLAKAQALLLEAEREFEANLYWPSTVRWAESEVKVALDNVAWLKSQAHESVDR